MSGQHDFGANFIFAKKQEAAEFLVNTGYEKVGDPDRGLRVQFVNSAFDSSESFLVGDVLEAKLDLKDYLLLGAGVNLPLVQYWEQQAWFVAELSYTRSVGGGTPVERLVHPLEMRLRIQFIFPGLRSVSVGAA